MRVPSLRLVAALLGLACSSGMFAQGAQNTESLLIGPGDTIQIQVFEAPDLEQAVKVTDAGDVRLILGGTVNVKGLTPPQASDRIEEKLRVGGFILNPHVSVTVTHYATQSVSVFGEVRSPGSYPVETPRNLIDVLSTAGGLKESANRRITIWRHTAGTEVEFFVPYDTNMPQKDVPSVDPGDTVIVKRAPIVYVLGDVGHPGGYANTTNQKNVTVLQVIALSGGTLPSAVPSRTRLIRRQTNGPSTVMDINVSAMQKGNASDIELQDNDILYVPFSYIRNVGVNLSSLVAAATAAAVYHF